MTTVTIKLTFDHDGRPETLAEAVRDHIAQTYDNEELLRVELVDGGLGGPVGDCTVVDGVLTCPNGHSGHIEHQEQQWEQRSVRGIENGVLKIEGVSNTLDDSGSGEGLFCIDCGAQFGFPAGVPVDYV